MTVDHMLLRGRAIIGSQVNIEGKLSLIIPDIHFLVQCCVASDSYSFKKRERESEREREILELSDNQASTKDEIW